MKIFTAALAILSVGSAAVTAQENAAPTPAKSTPQGSCHEVSVEADATFCIQGPICSGSGDKPTGANCPKTGDVATADCWDYVPSYADADGCVAPADAECKAIETGVWGCVWGAGSGSGSMETGGAGSTNASGSGSSDATITIPVNATSVDAQNPEDIQIPMANLKSTSLSSEGSSSASSASIGPIVAIGAAVAGIICAIAAAAYYHHKRRREQADKFTEVVQTPDEDSRRKTYANRKPLTPPMQDSRSFFSKA